MKIDFALTPSPSPKIGLGDEGDSYLKSAMPNNPELAYNHFYFQSIDQSQNRVN
jgi:hypothetical protein